MNHLIVYAHPNPESFNKAIVDTAVKTLEAKGHTVTVRDLYKLGFNPVLTGEDMAALRSGQTPKDIQAEQEYVSKADVITYIYPLWWTGLPAILKGYVDRVYSYGFAYAYGEDGNIKSLLQGKKGFQITTHGSPEEIYGSIGMHDSLKQTSDAGIFGFCGIESLDHLFFGSVGHGGEDAHKAMLGKVEQRLSELF